MLTTENPVDILENVIIRTLPVEFIILKDFNGQYLNENTNGISGSAVFMAGKVSSTGISGQRVKNDDTIAIDFNMVPKGVVSASIEPDGTGKARIIIEGDRNNYWTYFRKLFYRCNCQCYN